MIHKYVIPLTLALALGTFGNFPAQSEPEDQTAQLQQRLAEIRERLKLTEAQSEQITPIVETHLEAMRVVLEDYGIDLQDDPKSRKRLRLRELRALGKDTDKVRSATADKLSAVLDEAQMKEYRKIQAENKAEMREYLMRPR